MKIEDIKSRAIRDSRGTPTIEVNMRSGGNIVSASVPSGKSSGTREAVALRDEDGRGVTKALYNIEYMAVPEIIGKEFSSPGQIDELLIRLDGTDNKENMGANTILAISIAATKLFAVQNKMPVWRYIAEENGFTPTKPILYMNVINGGAHANFCLPFQEYILALGGEDISMREAYNTGKRMFDELGNALKNEFGEISMGDEGGYAPARDVLEFPFEFLREVIKHKKNVFIAIDVAASEFYDSKNGYKILDRFYDRDELLAVYKNLVETFQLRSIEDPFEENDEEGFRAITDTLGKHITIVGDDFTVTNPKILKKRISENAGNALIIKPNQIGTLQEVYEAVRMAEDAGWKTIASHRSGETKDPFIADFAVGIGAYGIKAGAPAQPERVVKYERLLAIEQEM